MIKTQNQVRVELNHLILLAKEKQQTAHFLTYLLGLPDATPTDGPVPGFFLCIELSNAITLLIAQANEHPIGHYAFKVSADDFKQVIQRLTESRIDYWAEPRMQRLRECYEENGNRGVYVIDPSGHGIEILTSIQSTL
jgi:catechol 2,3-dioxygenase-like lactoylglutathione lyase family enzyme